MTFFYLSCAVLLLLSAVFFFLPLRRADENDNLEQVNLQWYRQRQGELARDGQQELVEDARLRLIEDESQSSDANPSTGGSFPRWLLLPIIVVLTAGFYYRLGGATDVVIAEQLQALEAGNAEQQMPGLIAAIEKRAGQRPDNLHYLSLMARYHMGQSDYASAAAAYETLLESVPEDAQMLASAAQASYMAAGRVLNNRARLRAEQALAANPHQRTALGLLGMASFEQEDYRAAIKYWQRLLAVETPGSPGARMIEDVLNSARQLLGEAPPAATDSATSAAGVTVRVSLPAGGEVRAQDTVFVLARDAGSDSRMPIAVQRFRGADLPVTVRLDDTNSMAGRRISDLASVVVVVQVSPSGRPGEAGASWLAQTEPLAPSNSTEPLSVELAPNPAYSP